MKKKDRPKVEEGISRIDYGFTCSYERPTSDPKYLPEPIVPKYMANIVSEKGELSIKQLVTEIFKIVKKPSKKILNSMVGDYLKNGSCNMYLDSNRRIVERKGRVLLMCNGINTYECCTVNGYVCSRNRISITDITDSAIEYLKETRSPQV